MEGNCKIWENKVGKNKIMANFMCFMWKSVVSTDLWSIHTNETENCQDGSSAAAYFRWGMGSVDFNIQ